MNEVANKVEALISKSQSITKKVVTVNELVTILTNLPDSIGSIANVVQLTEPKITVKDRQTKEVHGFNSVQKLTNLNILLNTSYERGVVNQLNKENKPKEDYNKGKNTMPLEYGENNKFVGFYKGKAVLEYRAMENSNPVVTYFIDGKETNINQFPDILPKVSKAKNQGTVKEIFWRKLYLKNLAAITINKVQYIVSH